MKKHIQMVEDHSSYIRVNGMKICCSCYSKHFIKNGTTRTWKQQYFCKNCNKRFTEYYSYNANRKTTNSNIIQLTKERVRIRSTAQILKISATTLLKRIISIVSKIFQPQNCIHQYYELDEMRIFIRGKTKSSVVGLCN